MELGVPLGQHIVIHKTMSTKEVPEGEEVTRKYTPISAIHQKGNFDLLIKVYRPNVHPKFPDGGKLTPFLESLNIGDTIQITGPRGKIRYLGHGVLEFKTDTGPVRRTYKKIGMVAGGTGITPMF
jgi:cytochrome-b5 reductase